MSTNNSTSRKRPHPEEDSRDGPATIETSASADGSASATKEATTDNDLPPELASVDFSQRVSWGKYDNNNNDDDGKDKDNNPLPLIPEGTPPVFAQDSPALCCQIHATCGRARAASVHLARQPGQMAQAARPVPTPMFMPVGTKGCLKGVELSELLEDPALGCPIILANTYHLAIQPGTELVHEMGGLHAFQGLPKYHASNTSNTSTTDNDKQPPSSYNLLTDSGGFQMVSLVKLSQVTEEGVSFENPFQKQQQQQQQDNSIGDDEKDMLMLRPEDSIRHQNNISANIIMALDDVVSSVEVDEERFRVATHRTLRWYDRCYKAHAKPQTQNLFPIVQGGLDTALGGLREQCLAGFKHRACDLGYQIPGYAIGGVAGGEDKQDFWRVVDQCCRALPDDKPRYLMGVGYPMDLVVCTALGVDMYDCVYPTRTARFGVALVPGPAPGTLRLRSRECSQSKDVMQKDCGCQACREGVSRARLHNLLKANNPLAVELITQHNICFMMTLVRNMRTAIMEDRYGDFVRSFVKNQYPGEANGGEDCPKWVVEALDAAGIDLSS